jgi:hypothetical protein
MILQIGKWTVEITMERNRENNIFRGKLMCGLWQ